MKYKALILLSVFGSWGCGAGDVEDVGASREALNIANGTEFKNKLTADPYGSYTLTADIDMHGAALQVANFYGQLDGANHTIRNVTQLLSTGSGDAGLFGTLQTATIKNLKLSNVNFRALSAGGLASSCNSTVIQNVSVQGAVEGGSFAGGICGGMSASSITGSSASGTVKSASGSAGGLAGSSGIGRSGLGPVISSSSVSSMTVTGGQAGGGLIGYCQDPNISWVAVNATVSAQTTAGGICGEMNGGDINNSYAKGASVTSSFGTAGGLVGRGGIGNLTDPHEEMQIVNSYSQYTNVTGRNETGGIIGLGVDPSLQEVYAVGNVTGSGGVGGLIGRSDTYSHGLVLNSGVYRGVVTDRTRAWSGVIGVADLTGLVRWESTIFDSNLDGGQPYLVNFTSQKPASTSQLKAPTTSNGGVYCFNVLPSLRCGDSSFTSDRWDAGNSSQHHALKNVPNASSQPR